MYPATITREEINALPLQQFEGKIRLITKPEKLLPVFKKINKHTIAGFDTESKPIFLKGKYNPVALIQIALPEEVFLIRVNMTGLTEEIIGFFENDKITKYGVALRDDLRDLKKIKPFIPKSFVELNHLVKEIGIESNGLRKLAATILGFRISKSAQVSNWEAPQLTLKQKQYAATDAWVCLEMFQELQKKGYF